MKELAGELKGVIGKAKNVGATLDNAWDSLWNIQKEEQALNWKDDLSKVSGFVNKFISDVDSAKTIVTDVDGILADILKTPKSEQDFPWWGDLQTAASGIETVINTVSTISAAVDMIAPLMVTQKDQQDFAWQDDLNKALNDA